MTGAEVAIVSIGIGEIANAAIWAVSSFAISMGLLSILEDTGLEIKTLKEGKKDDIPQMVDEIIQNFPKCKVFMKNKNRPFLDYTISSNIGLYSNENLGDIHFFPGTVNIKEIFESVGFKITPHEFIPEPETFPINNDDKPKNMPHPVSEPIDVGLVKDPPIFVPTDIDLPKNLPHPVNEPIPKTIPYHTFVHVPAEKNIKIILTKDSDIIKKIPPRLRKNDDYIDIDIFKKHGQKIRRKKAYREKGGWYVDQDKGGHGQQGKEQCKLKDENGSRIATVGEDGKILRD